MTQTMNAFSDRALSEDSYVSYEKRGGSINQTQSLWRVRDEHIACPEERFLESFCSPYVQNIIEGGCGGPLEGSRIPQGLVTFVKEMLEKFSVSHTELVAIEDVIFTIFRFLDYTEPYYILADAPVQLSSGKQLVNTYRDKKTKSVLPPDQIEVFEVTQGFGFDQYFLCEKMFKHEATRAVLRGEYVRHPVRGDRLTREDLVNKLGKILWGSAEFLESWVEEWIYTYYDSLTYDRPNLPDDVIQSLDSYKERDRRFWWVTAVSVVMWLKSPYALPFLIAYHPIYGVLLWWDEKSDENWYDMKGAPKSVKGSLGIAVVQGWETYNGNTLIIEEGVPAGACTACKESLHCTKLINSWATVSPLCDCGDPLPVEVDSVESAYLHVHLHCKPECKAYRERHPGYPRLDYVCQHCLFTRMQGLPSEMKCGRASCPNLKCVHHMGQQAHIRALTKNRTMMLTHKQPQ